MPEDITSGEAGEAPVEMDQEAKSHDAKVEELIGLKSQMRREGALSNEEDTRISGEIDEARDRAYELREKSFAKKMDEIKENGNVSQDTIDKMTASLKLGRDTGPHALISKPERHGFLESLGHPKAIIEKMDSVLNEWGGNESQQKRARAEIETAIDKRTPLGKALRDQTALETDLVSAYSALKLRGSTNLGWPIRESEQKLYRVGSTEGRIQSWSTNVGGPAQFAEYAAQRGLKENVGTWEKLKADGFSVLGGASKAMGAPGEGELTLIKL